MGAFFGTLENLATMLSNTSAFKTFTNTASSEEALTHIYYVVGEVDDDKYPFAIITYMDGDFNLTREAESAGIQSFSNKRTPTMCFVDKQEYSNANQTSFMQTVDLLLTDILAATSVNNTDGNAIIDGYTIDGSGLGYDEQSGTYQVSFKLEMRS